MATSERRGTGSGKDRRTGAKARTPAPAQPVMSSPEEPSRRAEQEPAQTQSQLPREEDRRREAIAKAAYYNAERRGFDGNRELDDWLEAEKEIDSRAGGAGIQHEASALSESTSDLMASNIQERASGADGDVIKPPDVQKWAKKLKVPAPRLREAIQRVGPVASDVRRYLNADGRPES
jgi:hypothetical protein